MSATKVYATTITCDVCGKTVTQSSLTEIGWDVDTYRERLSYVGWIRKGANDICPVCADLMEKLKKEAQE